MKPARFRRPRILIVGCGDTGMLLLAQLATRARVFALTSQPARVAELRDAGAVPLVGNLDDTASLRRLRGLAGRAPRATRTAPIDSRNISPPIEPSIST